MAATVDARLARLERAVAENPCPGCAGASRQYVVSHEAPPPESCPDCGRELEVIVLADPYREENAS